MKKGFTLVELLAVIVILALIVIITIPLTKMVIENAKLGSLKSSTYGMIEVLNLYHSTNPNKVK